MSEHLFCGLRYNTLYLSMAMLLLMSSVSVIICLVRGTWVSQREGYGNKYWEGSLFKPLIGLEQFDGMSYADISSVYCNTADNQDLNEELYLSYRENCNLFFYLDLAGVCLILFEVMTVTIVAIWIVILLLNVAKINCTPYGICISLFPIITHTIGIVTYTSYSNIELSPYCREAANENELYSLCPELNYLLVLLIEVLYLLMTILMCILGCKYMMHSQYKLLSKNVNISSTIKMQDITDMQAISNVKP